MESERLATVGQLAANVAHELNNPLQGIVTYSSLLLEKTFATNPRGRTSKRSPFKPVAAARSSAACWIFRGRRNRRRRSPTSMPFCGAVFRWWKTRRSFTTSPVAQNLDGSLPMIVVDPSQIERVFLNLIINAAEAMDEGGTLTLTTSYGLNAKSMDIEVKDTGTASASKTCKGSSNPFFTTKEIGHGVGLGLAIITGSSRNITARSRSKARSASGANLP